MGVYQKDAGYALMGVLVVVYLARERRMKSATYHPAITAVRWYILYFDI